MLASSRISIVPRGESRNTECDSVCHRDAIPAAGSVEALRQPRRPAAGLGSPELYGSLLMIEVAEAEALILANVPRLPARREALADCVGRVLAEDILAERDQPPFDRVTMDGIAIAFRDFAAGVRVVRGRGHPGRRRRAARAHARGAMREVMTGAILPRGADTVMPVERVTGAAARAEVEQPSGRTDRAVRAPARQRPRAWAASCSPPGTRFGPPEIAVLASAGRGTVAVAALPRVAVISTGDELVDVDEPLAPYQIRSSNDRAIEASLTLHRLARVTRARLRDESAALAEAIARLDADSDALVLSGGVSMGQFDLVPAVLAELGARLVFHKIRQRPGKPMWFGVKRARQADLRAAGQSRIDARMRDALCRAGAARGGRPGPAAAGARRARGARRKRRPSSRTSHPVTALVVRRQARLLATPRPTNTSGDFVALAGTDGFVELAAKRGAHAAGTVVRLFRW